MNSDEGFLHKDETYQLIGAAFEVYNELGCALLEPIYQDAYEKELSLQGIPLIPKLSFAFLTRENCSKRNTSPIWSLSIK